LWGERGVFDVECFCFFFINKSYLSSHRLYNPGDKIPLLDFLITCAIYNNPRKFGPGKLTDLRSALVNNTTFACIAVRNGFHKYFKRTATALDVQIENFVKNQNDINHQVEFFVSIF
jgi:endoribonuclease Dicer